MNGHKFSIQDELSLFDPKLVTSVFRWYLGLRRGKKGKQNTIVEEKVQFSGARADSMEEDHLLNPKESPIIRRIIENHGVEVVLEEEGGMEEEDLVEEDLASSSIGAFHATKLDISHLGVQRS